MKRACSNLSWQFLFNGSKESIRRQIGMAVLLRAKLIFKCILNTLSSIKYEYQEESISIK